jgi:hypothetical protein
LHHVDQHRLEFKVFISHYHGWSGRDIGVKGAENSRIVLWAIGADEVLVYGIDGARLLSCEKLLKDKDSGSHSPHK